MPVNSFENYPMTWKPKLVKGTDPLYISLANQLEADIADGILLPGTKLPPQRELADFLDINVSTVSRAFKICAIKGILSGTVGSGTFVAYDVNTNIFDNPDRRNLHLIEMGSLVPETIPQDEAVSLLQKMIIEPDFGRLLQYNYAKQYWQKEAAVKLISKAGYPARADSILMASGGQNAIASIFAGLFHPGDKIGTDPLIYPGLKSAAKLFGIQLVPIRQENEELSEEGIVYAYRNDSIKAIYVMPDFQNPTTHTMSDECRDMIASTVQKLGLLVIEDGINSLMASKPKAAIAVRAPEHTIYISSLSKTVIPALRLSYIVAPPKYYKDLDNALYNINLSQSTLLTEIASRIIVSGKLDALLETRRKGLQVRNQIVDDILQGFDVRGGSECVSRWLILPDGITGRQFEHIALEKGVHVYGSERFVVGKEVPIDAVRLGICAPGSLEELTEGLKILRHLLEEL